MVFVGLDKRGDLVGIGRGDDIVRVLPDVQVSLLPVPDACFAVLVVLQLVRFVK